MITKEVYMPTTTIKHAFTDKLVPVTIGSLVHFKSDIEQAGVVIGINVGRHTLLTLENRNGFHGGYIGGKTITVENAADCWIE